MYNLDNNNCEADDWRETWFLFFQMGCSFNVFFSRDINMTGKSHEWKFVKEKNGDFMFYEKLYNLGWEIISSKRKWRRNMQITFGFRKI